MILEGNRRKEEHWRVWNCQRVLGTVEVFYIVILQGTERKRKRYGK